MNSLDMQRLEAQSGVRGADEVGIFLAPRLDYNFSTQVYLSDLHKAAAQPNPASDDPPLTRDKTILCCRECNHIHTAMHVHSSPDISELSCWPKGGSANISK